MSYLETVKRLEKRLSERESGYEKNELNEERPGNRPEPAESTGCPGLERCAGCYSVGSIDGRERFIHPPQASPDWQAWLRCWLPKGRIQ